MPTINQLVRKPRRDAQGQVQGPGPGGLSAEARRVPAGQDHDPQEAELGPAQGRPRAAVQRQGSHRLHPRRRPQPAGALDRAGPRRPRPRPARRALPHRPRHARLPGRRRPQAGPLQVRREAGRRVEWIDSGLWISDFGFTHWQVIAMHIAAAVNKAQ